MSIFSRLFGGKENPAAAVSTPPAAPPTKIRLDADYQPHAAVNRASRKARDTNEALGVLRGLIADGTLSREEVVFLGAWLVTNQEFAAEWPFSELADHVTIILRRGEPSDSDLATLYALIERITGSAKGVLFQNTPTELPLTSPAPSVQFVDKEFVLTGKFEFGPRALCESAIVDRGGRCGESVTLRSHFLVIGSLSSRDWGGASSSTSCTRRRSRPGSAAPPS